MSCENFLSHSWDLTYEDSLFAVWPCMSIHSDVPTAKYFNSAFSNLPIHLYYEEKQLIFPLIFNPSPFLSRRTA